ncbi:MAG: hypothetical protein E6Q76_03720 [Rhizobium sp.]|nr:MAG: hypothetical protein E6Q76_03720 [Rhizobium sp.]
MWRQRCCCGCTFKDYDFPDPDGSSIVESFDQFYVQDDASETTQIVDDGSPFDCKGKVVASQPPCRELSIDGAVDVNQIFATELVVDLGPILQPALGDIYQAHALTGLGDLPPGVGPGKGYVGGLSGSIFSVSIIWYYVVRTGGTLSFTLLLPSGYYATFSAAVDTPHWDETRGMSVLDETVITLPLVTNTIPTTGLPPGSVPLYMPSFVTLYANHRATDTSPGFFAKWKGRTWGYVWWRFYDETTFDPDGSTDQQIGYQIDSYAVGSSAKDITYRTVGTTAGSGAATASLAIQQGSVKAYTTGMIHVPATPHSGSWFHDDFVTVALSSLTWGRIVDFNLLTGAPVFVPFVPDLSNGAPPITFGIMLRYTATDSVEAGTSRRRIDQFCFRWKN